MSSKQPINVLEIPKKPKKGDSFLIKGDGVGYLTHGVFKYPCKFIPHIPRWFISSYGSSDTTTYGVLDPFMGSGTSLVEANILGYPAYGIDIDPLSKLLSKVKTTKFSKKELNQLEEILSILPQRLNKEKILKSSLNLHLPDYEKLDYWFSADAIQKLLRIKYFMAHYVELTKSRNIGDLLLITLASIIRKSSLADEQSPKPYISKRIAKPPIDIYGLYLTNLAKNFKAIGDYSAIANLGKTKIIGKDARSINLSQLKGGSVHLAVTSPPYINAFDYVRSLRLENFWLTNITDAEISSLYDAQVGTEKVSLRKASVRKFNLKKLDQGLSEVQRLDPKRALIISEYFSAMNENIDSIFNALVPGGNYCIVVGDSIIRGVNIPTSRILIDMARRSGFRLVNDFSYVIRNRYLRIPRGGKGGLIPVDYVLVFEKPL